MHSSGNIADRIAQFRASTVPLTALIIALATFSVYAETVPDSTSLLRSYRQLQSEYATELESLADQLTAADNEALAETIREWPIPAVSNRDWLFVPTDAGDADALPTNDEFTNVRKQHAKSLWKLAQQAAQADQPSFAVQLAHHTLREDPTHTAARKMVRVDDDPRKIQTGVGKTRNKTYGWAPGDYRWARSEHFQLVTTCNAKIAESLVSELETLFAVWSQLFAEFRLGNEVFRRAWDRGELPAGKRSKYRVVLFADRDEYINQLRRLEPQIALSQGVYRYQQRTAFFYYGDEFSLANMRHEVVHQLFHEAPVYGSTKGAGAGVGEEQDFWAIEGIAMYFETMRADPSLSHQGYYTVGGPDAERLQFARHRALNANEYTPMADLTMQGRETLQTNPRVRQLYSQSGGWAHFLMTGQQQAYRAAFRDYLYDLYKNKKSARTIAQRANVSFAELDNQYKQFLSLEDADLTGLAPDTERLSLGNTRVTDEGLSNLVPLKKLNWLDLSATPISDASAANLSTLDNLETLWLAGTNITDASVPSLVKLTKLTELDLRGTNVTTQGRQQLRAALPKLKTLLPNN